MRSKSLGFMLLMSTALTGCATFKPPQISYDDEQPAVLQADPPKPVQVVELVAGSVRGHHLEQVADFQSPKSCQHQERDTQGMGRRC